MVFLNAYRIGKLRYQKTVPSLCSRSSQNYFHTKIVFPYDQGLNTVRSMKSYSSTKKYKLKTIVN